MNDDPWRQLAQRQRGMVARRQFRALGIARHVIHGNVAAGRWVLRTDRVVSTFTGPLLFEHRLWLGVLHAGGNALIGGLSAAAVHGLRRWDRPSVTVLVDDRLDFETVPGVEFVRTRRDLRALRTETGDLPLCRIEPAALLFAGYCHSERTALGLLAALVQQELTDPEKLAAWVRRLRPLRRARLFQQAIDDIAGGSQSLGELDVARFCRRFGLPLPSRQTRRRDSSGRVRFTDCEWRLVSGHVVVLEVDGAFHRNVEQWEADIARQRGLTRIGRSVVRCTARELRDRPEVVFRDLAALGVLPGHTLPAGRSVSPGQSTA
jgi:hypothetical protein